MTNLDKLEMFLRHEASYAKYDYCICDGDAVMKATYEGKRIAYEDVLRELDSMRDKNERQS